MEATYKNLWAIIVKSDVGEMFAEYSSLGYPPIDRHRTVLCGSEFLAQRIIEKGEYTPKGKARVVSVVVNIRED